MTGALGAFGVLLKIGDGGGPEVFTNVAEILDVSGPSLSLETIDVTHHGSVDGWREYIAGLLDAGEITFDVNFIPTNDTQDVNVGLLLKMKNRVLTNFKIIFNDALLEANRTTWAFPAYVTQFEPAAPVDDKLSGSVTLKIAGKPTLA